jgi:hypothetical protein
MSHFASSPAIASFNDFLTLLMVMITVVFSFYLTMMFTLGAIDRYSLHLSPSHCSGLSQRSSSVTFQDTIQPFKRPLTHLTIRQLKQRAKEVHIPKYSRMTKLQLITALQLHYHRLDSCLPGRRAIAQSDAGTSAIDANLAKTSASVKFTV